MKADGENFRIFLLGRGRYFYGSWGDIAKRVNEIHSLNLNLFIGNPECAKCVKIVDFNDKDAKMEKGCSREIPKIIINLAINLMLDDLLMIN